jgi:dTDP-4-dehydrorhamnose reductase
MSKRILILGASGFIGGYLLNYFKKIGYIVQGTFKNNRINELVHLDLLNISEIQNVITDTKPDTIIFLAGTKDVVRCEKDPVFALDTNVQVVKNYLEVCTNLSLTPRTIFFSTDYVFDGLKGYFKKTDHVSPRTVYGATNMLAEKILQSSSIPTVILRVSAVMGSRAGFFKFLYQNLTENKPLVLYNNTYFSPTSIGRLCAEIQKIVERDELTGVEFKHLSDGYRLTRFEFGRLVAKKMKLSVENIEPINADTSGSGFQPDLSILPDNLIDFKSHDDWNEMEFIF